MRTSFAIAAGLAIFSLAGVAFAQDTPSWPPLDTVPQVQKSGTDDVAVLVAVEDYAFLPDVPGARTNLADWERFLVDGLGVKQTFLLTNQQAVREQILKAAERAASQAKPGGTLWFLFIGHGAPNAAGNDGLLIGADGQQNPDSMNARGVAQQELIEALEQGQQARTIVVFDACFSGRDGSGKSLAEGTMPVLPAAPPKASGETVVMTAARADEFAGDLPGAGRPAFSYLLLGAMRGWGDDGDGVVTTSESVRFATRELLRITDRQQTPQLFGSSTAALARGVSETRPTDGVVATPQSSTEPAAAAQPTTPAPETTTNAETKTEPVVHDNIPDSAGFVKWYGGFAYGSDVSGQIPLGMAVQAGAKLNYFYQKPYEVRVFGFGYGWAQENPHLPEAGEQIADFSTSDPYTATGDETFEPTAVLAFGGGLGYALRHEYGDNSDFVLDAGAGLGFAVPLAERCTVFANSLDGLDCADTSQNDQGGDLALMARIGAHMNVVDLAWTFGMISDTGRLAMMFSLGYSFDP